MTFNMVVIMHNYLPFLSEHLIAFFSLTEWGEVHDHMFWKDANCHATPHLIDPHAKFEKGQAGAQKCKEKCIELRDGQSNPCLGYTFITSFGHCYLKSINGLVKLCSISSDSISARVNQGLNRFCNV